MTTPRGIVDWQSPLLTAGGAHLAALSPLLDAADPEGRVTPRARLLCAALGLLGEITHAALGGGRHRAEVGLAAAALSLLTKVDDEVIDRPSFHGGATADRAALREKTEAFLAPTLASIRAAAPVNDEPRCALAAEVGRRLRALAPRRARLDHLLAILAEGWSIQVDAVAVLSSHPGEVSLAEVARTTRRISGAWLLMIAAVGALPDDVERGLSEGEEEAFFRWGFHIQRADALADLEKDNLDGLIASWAGRLLWEREGEAYSTACARFDAPTLYAMVARHGVDVASFPEGWLGAPWGTPLDGGLDGLGAVPSLLAWIHGFLAFRYLTHPLCRRARGEPAFRRLWDEAGAFTAYLGAPAPPLVALAAPPRLEAR